MNELQFPNIKTCLKMHPHIQLFLEEKAVRNLRSFVVLKDYAVILTKVK